jgi:hypothetical protein
MCPAGRDSMLGSTVQQIQVDVIENTAAISVAGDPRTQDFYPELPLQPHLALIYTMAKSIIDESLGCRFSAQEFARTVGGGTAPYQYAIRYNNGIWQPWSAFYTDPQDAIIELGCPDVGQVIVQIKIKDALDVESVPADCVVTLLDNGNKCLA